MIASVRAKKVGGLIHCANDSSQKSNRNAGLNRLKTERLVSEAVTLSSFVWNRLPRGCCLFGHQYPGTLAS
jgi:hypothetical protein